MLDKAIKITYGLLFFVTPLIMYPSTSEIFEFNKLLFIYMCTIIVMALWSVKMIQLRRIIIKKTIVDIPIVIFLIILILSTIFSIDRHTSLWGYYGRFNGGVISILSFIVLYYGFVSNIGKKYIEKVLLLSVYSSLAVILWGLPGKFGYDLTCFIFTGQLSNSCWTDQFRPSERMFSTLGQPNWLGAYLAVTFFIALYFLFKQDDHKKINNSWTNIKEVCLNIYIPLNFLIILYTRSRSALVSVAIGCVLFIMYEFYIALTNGSKKHHVLKIAIFSISLFCMTLLGKTGIPKIDALLKISAAKPVVVQNLPAASLTNQPKKIEITDSLDIRKIVWQGAIELGKQYPMFGTGPETFAYAYYFVRPQSHNLTTEWDYIYNKAHNEYLNYLATTGYLGLIAYMSVITMSIYAFAMNALKGKKNAQLLSFCLLLSYITILLTNFFGFSVTTVNLFFFLLPAFILASKNEETEQSASKHYNPAHPVAVFGIIVASAVLLFGVFSYWYADTQYKKGDDLSKGADYQNAAFYLSDARKWRSEHVYDDKLSFVLANLAYQAASQQQNQTAKQLVALSYTYNKNSISSSPENILYYKTRAKDFYLFFQSTNNPEYLKLAIDTLNSATKLAPTDPKIPYSLAVFYSILGDVYKDKQVEYRAKSLEAVNKAIQMKSDYKDNYMLKAQLLKKYGSKTESKKVFQYVLDHFDPHDQDAIEGTK